MKVSRRMFLGGAAASIALPFLPSALPRGARASDEVPKRVLFFYVPNGVRMDLWRPVQGPPGLGLGPTMASSLTGFEDDLLVISGLTNMAGRADRPGDHARGTASFLTCRQVAFDGVQNDVSVDQVIATAWKGSTPFASLELGCEPGGSIGICDSGYSCAYTQNISWSGSTSPMPKLTQPRIVFERLFAGTDGAATASEALRRAAYRTSVLDVVSTQATTLKGRLAQADRYRLDEYLTGVREVEERIERLGSCGSDAEPPDGDVPLTEVADVMLDLAVNAFRCDLTRVCTFMLANAGSNRVYDFLPGVRGAHHEVSHHQGQVSSLGQLEIIDRWEVARFARLVSRLAETVEGEGSLLDNTVVLFSSEISDGNAHNHDDLPVLLAGRGGGVVGTGRHLISVGEPMANLYLGLMQGLGIQGVGSFGQDGTAPLAGLAG